jgi:hypothetical protein
MQPHITVVVESDDMEFPPISGEFDWWYGEIVDGVFAYVITTEDENGHVGSADWQGLPVVLKSHILAGLRGTLPSRAGAQRTTV